MGAVRVMWIGHGPSGLAEDQVVNTFHFKSDGELSASTVDLDYCLDRVEAFYTEYRSPGGPNEQTAPLASYLSPWVQNDAELRAYDLREPGVGPGTGVDRTPRIRPMNLAGYTRSNGLPEEVALCLSFNGLGPSAPRRRGRIYFGPVSGNAQVSGTGGDSSHPNAGFQHNLCMAGKHMAEAGSPNDFRWAIRSTVPTENFVTIFKGYVDNAWDTQIRRGPTTTSRETWITDALPGV